jgi:hypothetical protein
LALASRLSALFAVAVSASDLLMACRTYQFRVGAGFGRRAMVLMLALGIVWLAGCKEPDQIRQYSVENDPLPEPTHRMLAVLVPEESKPSKENTEPSPAGKNDSSQPDTQAWFFKIVGAADEVEAVANTFDQFIASVRTGKDDRPEWQLPEGWVEDPAGRAPQFGREAMIRIAQGESRLDLAVSKLPMPVVRQESWLLRNLNRWRGQMNLPAVSYAELGESTEEIRAGDQKAIKVDLRGVFSGGPMAGKLARASANTNAAAAPQPVQQAASPVEGAGASVATPFEAKVPEGWTPGRTSGGFRVAAYNILDDEGKVAAEMTVTPLGPAAGDLKANVDRWRQEIKLPPTTPAELDTSTKTLEIDGRKADYVHLVGPEGATPREATLGVILRRPDRVWFFKLRGKPEIVEREKSRFEEYLKSVKFK